MSGIVWIIYIAIIVAVIAGWWMIFTKAGEAGWKSLIPIWNILVLLKIIGREWWWIILILIPLVNSYLDHRLARPREELRPGHRVRYRPAFLGFIFAPILGFGSDTYKGPDAAKTA